MRPRTRLASLLLLAAAAASPCLAQAQSFSADYNLPRTQVAGAADGLSIEAGQRWFGRFTLGRSLETDTVALGGGVRLGDGQQVSLQFSRGRGQDRVGLAVRYDWPRYFVRLGYDPRPGDGSADMLRFSAGMRF